jgi:hypothetical protein
MGDNYLAGWTAFVVRKNDSTLTAPNHEKSAISAYVSSTGEINHAAFTSSLVIGDELLIINTNVLSSGGSVEKDTGSVTDNWNSGAAPSGAAGAELLSETVDGDEVLEVSSFIVDVRNMTVGAVVTCRVLQEVAAGTFQEVYNESFTVGTDPDGCHIIAGPIDYGWDFSVEVYSNNALDDGAAIPYYWVHTTKEAS